MHKPERTEGRTASNTDTPANVNVKANARRHPQPSRLLLAMMQRMQSWLGGLLARLGRWFKSRRERLAEAARSMSFELLEPRVLMSADLFPAAVGMTGAMHFSPYAGAAGDSA